MSTAEEKSIEKTGNKVIVWKNPFSFAKKDRRAKLLLLLVRAKVRSVNEAFYRRIGDVCVFE